MNRATDTWDIPQPRRCHICGGEGEHTRDCGAQIDLHTTWKADVFRRNNFEFVDYMIPPPPPLSITEFIETARKLMHDFMDVYNQCWEDAPEEDEERVCTRCNGFTQIEQGGETVDCPLCNGTGERMADRVFNNEKFEEFIHGRMIEGYCDLVERPLIQLA